MSLRNSTKFPPITASYKRGCPQDCHDQPSKEDQGEESPGTVSVQHVARKLCWMDTCYIYATPGRKPQLLRHLESYVNRELQTLSPGDIKFQELKLQIYRNVFGCFIQEFRAYQPLLSAIKKEYESTLAYHQDQIQELEPLRSRLRTVTEECDRKIQACCEEKQAEIGALKNEKQQLQKDLEAMRKREKAMQNVLDRLQAEVSDQYLLYREERDARKLLIWQLNDLTRDSVKEEDPADKNTISEDLVGLQIALKVCRGDLTKAQEELVKFKAEHWDVVPRRNWDTLTETHTQTLLQLKTLQGDFDQLKKEYDTLLELHTRSSMQNEGQDSIGVQEPLGEVSSMKGSQGNRDGLHSEQTRQHQ
ncbi:translin-associated factor X-interacting protein 1 isoform X1 [Xyrichtys novacula]|uniref:Translin-associated factor X-interacting protein 1 isoform X1 n=1 Tax=Xyrichtys novacula TaxID=13765 RepID=A0AAV1F964_XYRNO|nr:translin-associated factor X-interacting protein 1 isoform X1 [Xyrichtys novacula]